MAKLQWKRMVDDLAKTGKLTNCMAICDVSGSMYGTPEELSVALGLLISDLSEGPWKVMFSANPQFHMIKGDTIPSKISFRREMEWGANMDLQKDFDRILEVAVRGKLSEDHMINTLFVFSNLEFDQASSSISREIDYKVIRRHFHNKRCPRLCFGNSFGTPLPSNQEGVALVSGFSKTLVTLFLEEGGIVKSDAMMLLAIS
ncbi:hypothetical protein RJ640_012289 [Escallonia rubra]|uniref:DUF7788 domain-containing protein n=1 Tax=Escallonia rubra TaxID=112253 RepID=A0AA88U0S2_9ASTE|nr:hypothetical protein RJ640_012289 [Escallonia rubra]